jgi:hypothetical protein
MWRHGGLKLVSVVVGLLFTADVYLSLIGSLLHAADSG